MLDHNSRSFIHSVLVSTSSLDSECLNQTLAHHTDS